MYVTCCFSLAAFNILSLSSIFVRLISICLGMFLFGVILYGTLCFLDLIDYFLSHVGEVFNYNSFKKFSQCLSFFLLLLGPLNSNIGVFHIVLKVSDAFLNSFYSFLFILLFNRVLFYSYFHHSILQLIYPFLCLSYSASGSF